MRALGWRCWKHAESKNTFAADFRARTGGLWKLNAPDAKRTVIFYAHYDGQPVDPAAWTERQAVRAGAA